MFSSAYLRALEVEKKEPNKYVNNLKGHQCVDGGWGRSNVWSMVEKSNCETVSYTHLTLPTKRIV